MEKKKRGRGRRGFSFSGEQEGMKENWRKKGQSQARSLQEGENLEAASSKQGWGLVWEKDRWRGGIARRKNTITRN